MQSGPGRAVHHYTRGNRRHSIILLDGIRKRDDEDEFTIKREFSGSFTDPESESVEVDVIHGTGRVETKVIFPSGRPPTSAWVTRREGEVETQEATLTPEPAGGGRQQIAWSIDRPRRHSVFTISWNW